MESRRQRSSHRVGAINKFGNNVIWLVQTSHMTCNTQSESFISDYHSYAMLKFVCVIWCVNETSNFLGFSYLIDSFWLQASALAVFVTFDVSFFVLILLGWEEHWSATLNVPNWLWLCRMKTNIESQWPSRFEFVTYFWGITPRKETSIFRHKQIN